MKGSGFAMRGFHLHLSRCQRQCPYYRLPWNSTEGNLFRTSFPTGEEELLRCAGPCLQRIDVPLSPLRLLTTFSTTFELLGCI